MLTIARHAIRSALAAAVTATHVHYDPLDRLVGGYRYEICMCGARRVREVLSGTGVPMLPGWDRLLMTGKTSRWTSAVDPAVAALQNSQGEKDYWYSRR